MWAQLNPFLAAGEPGFESDPGQLKIGDGVQMRLHRGEARRPQIGALLFAVSAIALHGCEGSHARTTDSPEPSFVTSSVDASNDIFPLSISADKKFLIDRQGRPFLVRGDSAWSIMVQLSKEEAIRYLDDRKARSFNTLLINLIEHRFSSWSPRWRNAAGDLPFSDIDDFTTMNEAYFAHCTWVIRQARERGMLVLLAPSYLGGLCGEDGWCEAMRKNGVSKLRRYGELVGRRFRDEPNVVWVQGGDHTPSLIGWPSDRSLVNAVATGIQAGDGGQHLHTAHWAAEVSAGDPWGISWVGLGTTYTYTAVHTYVRALRDFRKSDGVRPVLLIESTYENEHQSTNLVLRSQMYQPILAGETGFVFGNFPIWSFWRPGDADWVFDDHKYPGGWTTALDTPGARAVTILSGFFAGLAWPELRPDTSHKVLTSGYGRSGSDEYVLLASTRDGRLAIAYFTSRLEATIDLTHFAANVRARWFDPATGIYHPAADAPLPNRGAWKATPPDINGDGSHDWVLLLETI